MADVINLRRARKAKARAAAETEAAVNRVAFGRTRAEKQADEKTAADLARALDGARREP